MAVHIAISVFGDQQLARRLNKFSDRPRNLDGAYEKLKLDFFEIETKQFETEGVSGSGGWQALKPETIRAKHSDEGILRRTDRLFNSFTSSTSSDWAGYFTANEMFFGSSTPYGKYHQQGGKGYTLHASRVETVIKRGQKAGGSTRSTPTSWSGLPQRKPVDLTEANRRKMVKTFQMWLVEDDKSHYAAKEMWAMGRAT